MAGLRIVKEYPRARVWRVAVDVIAECALANRRWSAHPLRFNTEKDFAEKQLSDWKRRQKEVASLK